MHFFLPSFKWGWGFFYTYWVWVLLHFPPICVFIPQSDKQFVCGEIIGAHNEWDWFGGELEGACSGVLGFVIEGAWRSGMLISLLIYFLALWFMAGVIINEDVLQGTVYCHCMFFQNALDFSGFNFKKRQ